MDINDDTQLIELLADNYSCLHAMYRLGEFEGNVAVAAEVSPGLGQQFYVLKCDGVPDDTGRVSFKSAIDNLYALTTYVEGKRAGVAEKACFLLLKIKCLIYEAYDYWGWAPDDLERYFMQKAETFALNSRPRDMELWAVRLNGGSPFNTKNEHTGAVKYLLIASLLGVNSYIRRHSGYRRALDRVERIYAYAVRDLPGQHAEPRESYGVVALSLYLKGRILLAQGSFAESRVAFRRSAEAYVNRLRQKEEFRREAERQGKVPDEDEFKEKVSVTLRRAALVTAFGNGHLSFVNSEITRALESLTLARATLTRNAGRVFLTFVDVRYLACKRAAHSSNSDEIEKVVAGLEACHNTLGDLVEGTRYHQRAAVELALALYYKSKFSGPGSEEAYDRARLLLEDVIKRVGVGRRGESKNPHLLGDALIYKSYLLRSRFRSHKKTEQKVAHIDEINEAISEAERACAVSDAQGTAPLRSEAYAALGAAYTDLVDFLQKRREKFLPQFAEALRALEKALKENHENVRLEAASYLRLTRLCLLNKNTARLAHEYFEKWKSLEGKVEHAYLRVMARDLEKNAELRGNFHLVKVEKKLNYVEEEKKLREFLNDVAIHRFAMSLIRTSFGKRLSDKALKNQFIRFLLINSDYGNRPKVKRIVEEDENLLPRLRKIMSDASPDPE